MTRTRVAASVATALTAGAFLAFTAPAASAHVSVDPDEAEQGGYSTVNIKVPNERDNASTIRLEVHLDLDHPLASVQPQPVPGWEVEVETAELDEPVELHGSEITEAPSVITWTGGEIEPGQFQQFPISVGPLPEDVDQVLFKAVQTYDNDEVVRWIEEPVEGEAEPEHPAAVLALAPADGDDHGTGDDDAGEAGEAGEAEDGDHAEPVAAESGDDTTDTTARVLAGVGIAVGVAGVAFGVLAGRRRSTES
ncbi:YcnI family copper-binding membrane protein [Streptomyces sp. NBC_01803]|uniref:YcnI family copper-binding membrane protein n=1 Tax=Streptomyces sp. NBC_01803 TaxID=2975946 RepID=UPI002DDC8466|nr:YcnI family protein [Streptomyces sp. NBC_01803]WSA45362.1 YcnI family protein [Streptomyces sp. NBC_01803]